MILQLVISHHTGWTSTEAFGMTSHQVTANGKLMNQIHNDEHLSYSSWAQNPFFYISLLSYRVEQPRGDRLSALGQARSKERSSMHAFGVETKLEPLLLTHSDRSKIVKNEFELRNLQPRKSRVSQKLKKHQNVAKPIPNYRKHSLYLALSLLEFQDDLFAFVLQRRFLELEVALP
jgi:hypothetical protein